MRAHHKDFSKAMVQLDILDKKADIEKYVERFIMPGWADLAQITRKYFVNLRGWYLEPEETGVRKPTRIFLIIILTQ